MLASAATLHINIMEYTHGISSVRPIIITSIAFGLNIASYLLALNLLLLQYALF
jgi:hypothetical protein